MRRILGSFRGNADFPIGTIQKKVSLAERGGFEPPVGFKPTHAFQACALNHSAISPAAVSNMAAWVFWRNPDFGGTQQRRECKASKHLNGHFGQSHVAVAEAGRAPVVS